MKVYYRILSLDETEGNMVVRYFTDFLSEIELATLKDIDGDIVYNSNGYPEKCRTDYNITLYQNFNPTQEDIKNLIESQAPIQWFELLENIKSNSGYSLENILPLVGQKNEFMYSQPSNDLESVGLTASELKQSLDDIMLRLDVLETK